MPLGLPAPSYMSPGAMGRTAQGGGSKPTPTPTTTPGGYAPTRGPGTTPTGPSTPGGYAPPRNDNPFNWWDPPAPVPGEGSLTRSGGSSSTAGSMDPYASPENRSMSGYRAEVAAMDDWYKQQAYMNQAYSNQNANNNFLRMQGELNYLGMGADHINSTYSNDRALLDIQRRAQVDLAARQLGVDRRYAQAMWDNLQGDIGNRRGTAKEQLAIQNWLTGRNRQHTGTERDLSFARNRAEFDTTMRNLGYRATAAGAYTSAGHRADRQDARIAGFLGNAGANLNYGRSMDQLRAGERTDALGYRQTLDSLQNQYNNGLAGYNRDMAGNDVARAGIDNTSRQFDIRGNQLGLDRQNALNQNAWNQEQAFWGAGDRAATIRQQQAQYLAQLAAQAFA